MMKNILGPPVWGRNFKFREKNIRKGLRLMKNKNSFLILGIRRIGKSSFLKQIAYLIETQSKTTVCIELGCAQYKSILDFYKGIYGKLPKSLKVKFKKLLSDSSSIPKKLIDGITDIFDSVEVMDTKIDFKDKAMHYSRPLEEIVSNFFKESKDVVLFLDELPFFFENLKDEKNGINQITQVLVNLRDWRDSGLPMGITGSLNLHQQLDHLGISRKLLAGLNTIELDPLTREESKGLIQALLESEKCDWWKPEITDRLMGLLPDYVPYFLQYSFNELINQECKTVECVDEVFHNDIMSGLFKDFTYQFDERLKFFKSGNLEKAMLILDTVAKNEDLKLSIIQNELGDNFDYEILTKLIDFEFLKLSGDQEYSFGLKIIKNWWITKRGLNK